MSYQEVGQLYLIVSLSTLWLTCVQYFDVVGKVQGHKPVYFFAGGFLFHTDSHSHTHNLSASFCHSLTHTHTHFHSLSLCSTA